MTGNATSGRDSATVMILDDEEMVTRSIANLLEVETDYRLFPIQSPRSALELARCEHIDCVVTDFLMPEMDGLAFLKELKQMSPGIPPSVGYFESERFTAPGWKPLHANPAFDNMTPNDAYWATRIVAAYTEDDLRACIDAAEFSDPEAGPYLLRALMERRRKIIDYYYSKVNPLDGFRLDIENSALALSFEDRWVLDGAGAADQVTHRYRIGHGEKSWAPYQPLDGVGPIVLDAATMERMRQISADAKTDNGRVFNVQINSRREGHWGHWVKAYIYFNGDLTQSRLVGVERDS